MVSPVLRQIVTTAMLGLVVLVAWAEVAKAQAEPPFPHRRAVPPLPRDLVWLNTAAPIRLEDLRGKFVLFDFWTYCCINCMHVLPKLGKLEKAFPKNLVVVGVHSAKFSAEQDSQNILEAILRYQIEHPVINDARHVLWDAFEVQAWPTLVLVDPEGYAVWSGSGENSAEQIEPLVKKSLSYYRQKGVLDEAPVHFVLEAERRQPTPLRFPGKLLADPAGQRLFIADSGHHRLVVARMDGTLLEVIGSGEPGRSDGDYASAEFHAPQGMALDGERLYVADTENHLIRRVDLAARRVETVAGTGRQRREGAVARNAAPRSCPLDSPWDLWIHRRDLYIAMAGAHQIWRMRLDEPAIAPYAGNGREDIVDGPLLPATAAPLGTASFAQPSGLSSDGQQLFVADSEGSSLRAVPLRPARSGSHGGRHGPASCGATVYLWRCRRFGGASAASSIRWGWPTPRGGSSSPIPITTRSKSSIPRTGETHTLVGAAERGSSDAPPRFAEPAGISVADGRLYVADTNHHQIRVMELLQGNRVSTLALAGLEPPRPPQRRPSIAENFAGVPPQRLPETVVRAEQGAVRVVIELKFPPGYHLNAAAPLSYLVEADGEFSGPGLLAEESLGKLTRIAKPAVPLEFSLPVTARSGQQTVRLGLAFYYCREGSEGVCRAKSGVWSVPLRLSESAETATLVLAQSPILKGCFVTGL